MTRPYICKVSHGLYLELDCYEWAQLHLAEFGTVEPLTLRLLQKLLRLGDTYVDIGAHIGYVSLVARLAVGETGRVIAIEPQPYNCERLLRNWEINDFTNLSLHVAAAGAENGFVRLPQQARTDKSRLSLALDMPDALPLQYEVSLTTVDTILDRAEATSVRVIKIDVEGYESAVLRGLTKYLDVIDNIIFEALPDVDGGISRTSETCESLVDRGFSVANVLGDTWTKDCAIPENNLWAARRRRR